ncbi:hypothetical protein [Spirosoma sp.]|uniref:hypothetical protein n=1 Tax=Spirosoma sp. TaxID=1899569 RepID=UPI00261C6A11|nr:hypothetical protein [Spirosoma sp.]MCX6216578.1 hypothetical protein [Spirosoma sp.]
MKTISSGSKWLSILLVVCLSSRLYGQSISVTASLDSARAEFVANAKRINADLIKGDFAKEREEGYKATIAEKDKTIGGVTLELKDCQKEGKETAGSLVTAKKKLGEETNKKRAAKLENWGWRLLLAITVYAKIKGL